MTMEVLATWRFGKEQRIFSWLARALVLVSFLGTGCFEPPCRTAEIPDVGSAMGNEVFSGKTDGQDDVFQPSCGSAGAPDSAFSWRAPSSARYRFHTIGSELDTVLSVWTGDVCDGQELACNDDAGSWNHESVVDVDLEAGETVYVAVEGYLGVDSRFVVGVWELEEWHCSDGWDDDDDGLVDCADPDCDCECPNGMLPATLDEPLVGSTAGGRNFGASSCGGNGAPDTSLVWTPPRTGRYLIDTVGSTFDTVLYVQHGDMCGGAELACNDDANGLQSQVELALTAGQTVIITVDGLSFGDEGEYVLDIVQVPELDCSDGADNDEDGAVDCDDADCDCTCPSEDLGSVLGPGVYTGSTVDRDDRRAGSCGGDSAPDASFVWTAPGAGAFRIDTEGSAFDTVLYVQEDTACDAAEIACNDQSFLGSTSEVIVELAAGEAIVITVDGYLGASGDFVLNITEMQEAQESSCIDGFDNDGDGAIDCDDDDCDCTCPMTDLGTALGAPLFEGSTAARGNLGGGTCGGESAPDASFIWTAPEDGDYRIHTNGSSFDTVLYVQEGDVCGGAELACDDDAGGGLQSQVELGLTVGQTVIITVDGFASDAGSFALNIECLTCACVDLTPTADAEVWSRPDQVDINRGTAQTLTTAAWTYNGVPGTFRFLLRFDLGQIPATARIDSATLSLFGCPTCSPGHSSLSGSNEADLYLITSPWQESTVTWNNQPSLSAPKAYIPQSTSSLQTYHLDVANAVIEMRDNPAGTYGFGVKLRNEAYYRALQFQSRDYVADPARRPNLQVCYTP